MFSPCVPSPKQISETEFQVRQERTLKLKLQYLVHLMQQTDSLEKTLMLGETEGGRRRDDRG